MTPMKPMEPMKPMAPMKAEKAWWPGDLGTPDSTGAQNDTHYAYFDKPHRLAVRHGATVTVYDTGAHSISGFAQSSGPGGLRFSSGHGSVGLDDLKPA